jgi:FG-GAP-like repeat
MNLPTFLRLVFFAMVSAAAWAQNAVPVIYQPLVPSGALPGGTDFTLTVNGTGFVPGAVVNWNGVSQPTVFISSSQLQAGIGAASIAKLGTSSIRVVNPAPGGGSSNVEFFPVRKTLSSVSFSRFDHNVADSGTGGLVTGDFNNDGKLDVAVTAADNLQVFLGNGDGTFQPPIFTASTIGAMALLAADFNNDGKLDLFAQDGEGDGAIFLGNGAGGFTQLSPFATSANSQYMAAGDVNHDGNLDLVTVGSSQSSFSADVFLGQGNGTFVHSETLDLLNAQGNPALADFNGDNKLDLAVPDVNANNKNVIDVFLGNGDGTFQKRVAYLTLLPQNSVTAADVNGDGILDLVTNGVSVLLGNGDGTFSNGGGTASGMNINSYNVQVADFNGDGKPDVAVATGVGYLAVLLGDGKGNFHPPADFDAGPGILAGLGMGDFNNDGSLDLVDYNQSGADLQFSALLQTVLNVTPTNLPFGSQQVGTSGTPEIIEVTNIARDTLSLKSFNISGANSGDFTQVNYCGTSLTSGQKCAISVTFTPKAAGLRTATLSVTYLASGSPQTIALSGTGSN